MACASTVAVVVPSPAMSEVLEATSLTIWAPMFASLSSSSISFATVTPSLVTVGEPQLFSMMTFRPRGPSVTLTVLARMLSPLAMLCRALWEKTISLAAMTCVSVVLCLLKGLSRPHSVEHGEDVVLAQDQVLGAVDLDLVARVLGEQHLVARLHLQLAQAAVLDDLAVADGDDQRFLGLFLGRVGDKEPAGGLVLFLDALDENAVVERSDLHGRSPVSMSCWAGTHRRQAAASDFLLSLVDLLVELEAVDASLVVESFDDPSPFAPFGFG